MAKDIQVKNERTPMNQGGLDFFEDRLGSLFGEWPMLSRGAGAEIRETDKAYVLSAEVPGIPKDAINVNVSGNMLTIHAEQDEESENTNSGYRRQYRSFHQSFTLPSNVDPDQIEAHCENGLLEVWIPKAGSDQQKKIEVQSGKGGFLSRLMGKAGNDKKSTTDQKH